VFADGEQVAFKLRVGFGRAGERIRAAARLLASRSPSSSPSSSPTRKLSNPDTVEWTAPRRELTTPRGQGAEPRRDQHSRSVRPLDLFEVSGEPGMPEQAEATEPTLYELEVPPNVRPGMKLKLSLPGRVQKVVITVPAGAAPGRIISVSMLHNKVEARVKLHELTLAVESARLVATSNALEHAHNAPVQLPSPVDRFEDEHANTGTGSRLLTAPSPPAQLLSPAPHVRLAELEREMERRDSARLARLLERDAEQRTSAPLVRLSELELRLAARAQIAQTIDSPDIMRPESPELSLVNLDARSADWLTHTHSVSCLLSECSRGGSKSGLNPAELKETASPRPSLSRPISACSASSSASSAYEDAAGSSAFEQKSKPFWELQHKSEPFGGELQQGGASPAKASTSAAASDSTPAPARKPQSPSGSPPDIETPTMTPVSLRSDLFKWLQNEEMMDDLKEPEEPGQTF
jgi:hypothetical protein